MRIVKNSIILFVFFFSVNCIAQKSTKNGYPSDLHSEKIIFLEYEQIPVQKGEQKGMYKKMQQMFEFRNEAAVRSNQQLHESSKSYPFEFTISKRSEYKALKEKGYKYVLNNDIMEGYNNATNFGGRNTIYHSKMYIENIETGKKYFLFKLYDNRAYVYKEIIKKMVKQINKDFKIE